MSFTIAPGDEASYFAPICGLFPCEGRAILRVVRSTRSQQLRRLPAALPLFAAVPVGAGCSDGETESRFGCSIIAQTSFW